MYRSVSSSRVSDDMQTIQKPVSALRTTSISMDEAELSAYDLTGDMAKKEKSRIRFAENAVHLIPIVLLLCAFILWLFSNPNVELGIKAADSEAAKIDELAMEGDMNTDNDGTQTNVLPVELGTQTNVLPVEVGDTDKPKGKR